MKNLTVSLDDETYRRARVKAAEANTSVSALVKQFLVDLASSEGRFERLARLEEETRAEIKSFRAGDRLTRDQVHERQR